MPTSRFVAVKRRRPSSVASRILFNTGSVVRGKRRAFLIRQDNGRSVILQRTGRGSGKESWDTNRGVRHDAGLRVLYSSTKSARVPKRMHFVETVTGVVKKEITPQLEKAMADAIRTAKR